MPKLPKNMVRRRGRPGYYYREVRDGRLVRRFLALEYRDALQRLRSLKWEELPQSDLTVEAAARRWLSSYVQTARATHGQHLAEQRVRDFLVPHLGHILLHKVSAEYLRGYRLRLERTHLSVQSVRHVLSDCRCLLNWCEDAGLLARSPVPRRLLPRVQERPPDRLSDEEVAAVCAVAEPYGFIARLGLSTGMRWGEMSRAESRDVQGGWLVVHQTKSRKVRRVPIPRAMRDELRVRVGRLLSIRDADGFARQVRRATGIEHFHAHQLRHTFACRWLEAGGSLAALQEILGHASIVTTQRYGRLSESHVAAEAARIEGQVGPKLGPNELRTSR